MNIPGIGDFQWFAQFQWADKTILSVTEETIKFGNKKKGVLSAVREVPPLEALSPSDRDKQMAKNFYVRRALLETIKASLGHSLDEVGGSRIAKDFFNRAEVELFGDFKGDVGVSNLPAKKAAELVNGLKQLLEGEEWHNDGSDENIIKIDNDNNKNIIKIDNDNNKNIIKIDNGSKGKNVGNKPIQDEQGVNLFGGDMGQALTKAKKSCENYISTLQAHCHRLKSAIERAGFIDEWIIVYDLQNEYQQKIKDVRSAMDSGDVRKIENLLGLSDHAFENMKEPLSYQALQDRVFTDMKSAMSKALCSFMMLSSKEISKEEVKDQRETASKYAELLKDAFAPDDLDDFETKLARVAKMKKILKDNSKPSCILKFYFELAEKYENGEKFDNVKSSDMCKEGDGDYVANNASLTAFLGREDVVGLFTDYMQGKVNESVMKESIEAKCLEYLVEVRKQQGNPIT